GAIHLIYQYTDIGYFRVGYTAKPAGGAWSPGIQIFGSGAFSSGSAAMVMDPLGVVHAVAEIGSGSMLHQIKYRRYIPTSVRWTDTETITGSDSECFSPQLAIDRSGDIYVVYNFVHREYQVDTASIKVVKRTAGVWGAPFEIALVPNVSVSHSTGQESPTIQVAGDGTVAIAWSGLGWEPHPDVYALLVSETRDKGLTWTAPKPIVATEDMQTMGAQMMFASQPKSANPPGGYGVLFTLAVRNVAYALVSGACLTA
ncbi:MAG: hypothetical protein Q8R28_00120, partial [Dehalococcoidia bacterium]|nr:hypothetical protein [Dehalococcoidia bacterium]